MNVWLVLATIIAPALFWITYFAYKDRYYPEPLRNLGSAYLLGLLAGIACAGVYGWLPRLGIPEDPSLLMENQPLAFFGYCLAVVGGLEEIFKFLPFLLIIFGFRKFDDRMDGIIYASLIALGFASVENVGYLTISRGFDLFGRAVAVPLTHTIFSSIWGYSAGRARLAHQPVWMPALLGLSLAAVAHGLFDFLNLAPAWRIFSALLVLAIWLWRIAVTERIQKLAAQSSSQPDGK